MPDADIPESAKITSQKPEVPADMVLQEMPEELEDISEKPEDTSLTKVPEVMIIPPNLPIATPESFISVASVMIRHSTVSFSVSQVSRRIPLIRPSFRVNP